MVKIFGQCSQSPCSFSMVPGPALYIPFLSEHVNLQLFQLSCFPQASGWNLPSCLSQCWFVLWVWSWLMAEIRGAGSWD